MFNINDGEDYQAAFDTVYNKLEGKTFFNDSGDEATFEELVAKGGALHGLMTVEDIKNALTSAGYKDAYLDGDKGVLKYVGTDGE